MTPFKKTRNTVKKEILSEIPETVQERRIFLNKQMKQFRGNFLHYSVTIM